ncbi:MAG: hypothetical protein AAFV29_08290, partial [Myxococcota bacterium]
DFVVNRVGLQNNARVVLQSNPIDYKVNRYATLVARLVDAKNERRQGRLDESPKHRYYFIFRQKHTDRNVFTSTSKQIYLFKEVVLSTQKDKFITPKR